MPDCRHFAVRAATFTELLGPGFETSSAVDGDDRQTDARLEAWCRSSADGEWRLFHRRLARDGWDIDFITRRFRGARPTSTELPSWVRDAGWIRNLLAAPPQFGEGDAFPFADLFVPLVDAADSRLCSRVGAAGMRMLGPGARRDLRRMLMRDVTELCAPALYERFTQCPVGYRSFIDEVDLIGLVDDKPVLLRLIATLVRQWLDNMAEFVERLRGDAQQLGGIVDGGAGSPVSRVQGPLSDRHDDGRAVLLVEFVDGHRAVYKPREQQAAVACGELVAWLNAQDPPTLLRTPRTMARDGYAWSEFIEHAGCDSDAEVARFFYRAGAWLALLYCLAATDMHHENFIADGGHPIPIDFECVLQESDTVSRQPPECWADTAARSAIADSVLAVGLLPGYARSGGGRLQSAGGIAAGWSNGSELRWKGINSDGMRPFWTPKPSLTTNLPHVAGKYAQLDEHLDDFRAGFSEYARFLAGRDWTHALDRFRDVAVRKVLRPTQFYHLLLERLRDDRAMLDGVLWSVQSDFVVRQSDWNVEHSQEWPDFAAQRDALLALSVPIFSAPAARGLERVRDRLTGLDEAEIDWQLQIVEQTSSFTATERERQLERGSEIPLNKNAIAAAADEIASEVMTYAVRRGRGAAWTGLNWYSDSDASQLAVLGHDLYNGNSGIALFLAAHARARRCSASADLALAALARLRAEINGRNAPRTARLLGIGGATGMGSVVYALSTIGGLLDDDRLRDDAHRAAELISDTLVARDTAYDVIAGSAGAILGLLRLHRDSGFSGLLRRAATCADHLLVNKPPNIWDTSGMSHGSAGPAYALAALATAAERDDYARAALDYARIDRNDCCAGPQSTSQWCHGAVGSGLAIMGLVDCGVLTADDAADDIDHALRHVIDDWPARYDTLCCGTLGNIEFLRGAGHDELALRRLSAVLDSGHNTGSFRWNGGATRFNVGLFRGLSGVGYICLRLLDDTLPNVLTWE